MIAPASRQDLWPARSSAADRRRSDDIDRI